MNGAKPTNMPYALAVLMVFVGAASFDAQRCRAATVYQFNGQNIVWLDAKSTRFLSPTAFPTDSMSEALILESMALWNIVPGSDFVFSYSPLDQDYAINNYDGYNDTAVVAAAQLDPGVLGLTFLVNQGAEWYDTDVVFSDAPDGVGYTLDANPPCDIVMSPRPTNGYSFLLVATHEMGHALGLGHDPMGDEPPGSPWFVATMNPSYPAGGPVGQENIVEVHTDDRAGLRILYPDVGPPQPPVAELASAGYVMSSRLGHVEPLSLDPPSLYPGEQLAVSSVIENFGSTDILQVRQGFYLSPDAVVETTDELLGTLTWDLVVDDAFSFVATIDLAQDMTSGVFHVGAILDDLSQVTEEYEDNNAALVCQTVTIAQHQPTIVAPSTQSIACGQAYTGPAPALALPLNMSPVTWTLTEAPPGMTADPATGAVSWPAPEPTAQPYTVGLLATNAAGSGATTWSLSVMVGDIDGNGTVTRSDVSLLSVCLRGPESPNGRGCDCADGDRDGDVDLRDMRILQSAFGP